LGQHYEHCSLFHSHTKNTCGFVDVASHRVPSNTTVSCCPYWVSMTSEHCLLSSWKGPWMRAIRLGSTSTPFCGEEVEAKTRCTLGSRDVGP
jgi:hypothetical protein